MTEKDSYTGEVYWRQDELVARFVAFESDLLDMIDCKIRLAAGDVRLDRESEEYTLGYLAALEDYTDELEYLLHHRFKEIMNEIKDSKESKEEKIDLGEL